MATSIETPQVQTAPVSAREPFFLGYFSRLSLDSEAPWNKLTLAALASLVALWAFCFHTTWGAWGNLMIDSGHEMFVPAMLAQGKTLYRDEWFLYTPGGPYFTSYLFRIFGLHLEVLYWAGSLSALGSAVLLYLAGMKLSSWLAGWAAGAVVILQAFQPSLFCFPLPYSFSPVYGCLVACLFLWLVIHAVTSANRVWVFAAGLAAAAGLLLKLEYGSACYGVLGLLILLRAARRRSWAWLAKDLAAALPGVAACAAVGYWMVSLRGVEFITQENFMSWPTAFFMQKYGKMWLQNTGFALTPAALHAALIRATLPAAVILALCCLFRWKFPDRRTLLLSRGLCVAVLAYALFSPYMRDYGVLSLLFFPLDMVLYVAIAAVAAWWYFWRHSIAERSAAIPLVLTFAALLAFRILLRTLPSGYAIYYDGPAVLCFLLLVRAAIPAFTVSERRMFLAEIVICVACASVAAIQAKSAEAVTKNYAPLVTDRGTVLAPKAQVVGYTAAIQFMKDKAAHGESVMVVPEDTSLYFLSGTHPPTRYYLFTPGVIVPGQMTDELLRELDQNPPQYLIWSNRIFPEYGVPAFGKDFDVPLGNYLKVHYRRVGPLTPFTRYMLDWHAEIWERKPEGQ